MDLGVMILVTYVLIGMCLGAFWHGSFQTHVVNHTDHVSRMSCWCSDIWGDFFTIGCYSAALTWPVQLGFIGIAKLLKLVQRRRLNVQQSAQTINPREAGAALLHKALAHLVRACKKHDEICQLQDESIMALIPFSEAVLGSEAGSKALERMGNLEEAALTSRERADEFARLLHLADLTVKDHDQCKALSPTQLDNMKMLLRELDRIFDNYCFCHLGVCKKHGRIHGK